MEPLPLGFDDLVSLADLRGLRRDTLFQFRVQPLESFFRLLPLSNVTAVKVGTIEAGHRRDNERDIAAAALDLEFPWNTIFQRGLHNLPKDFRHAALHRALPFLQHRRRARVGKQQRTVPADAHNRGRILRWEQGSSMENLLGELAVCDVAELRGQASTLAGRYPNLAPLPPRLEKLLKLDRLALRHGAAKCGLQRRPQGGGKGLPLRPAGEFGRLHSQQAFGGGIHPQEAKLRIVGYQPILEGIDELEAPRQTGAGRRSWT